MCFVRVRAVFGLILAILSCSCRVGPPKFAETVEEFVYVSLSFTPVDATALGYHRHAGVSLDELLDDMSEAAMNRRRGFLKAFQSGLTKIDPVKLTPEDRADYRTIQAAIERQTAELSTDPPYKYNPDIYVQLILRGIDAAWNQPDQPETLRAFYVVRRLESVPALMQHAQRNLVARWNSGSNAAGRVEERLRQLEPKVPSEIRTKYEAARDAAIAAIREFELAVTKLPATEHHSSVPADLLTALQWDLQQHERQPSSTNWKEEAEQTRDAAYAQIQPLARRILRTHFGDPEMMQGWILYVGQIRWQQGETVIRPSWAAAMQQAVSENPEAVLGWRNWLCLQQAYGRPDFQQKVLVEGGLPSQAMAELLVGKELPASCVIRVPPAPN